MELLMQLMLPLLLTVACYAAPEPCPQINKTLVDVDGIPFCPESVKENAFTVTRCAYSQARSWHAATNPEKSHMMALVDGLKAADAKGIASHADALKLQVCRSAQPGNKFLLLYTKPGVKDYAGPFIMYREGNQTSQVVAHSPHDGQDGTHASTKAAFQNSNALALISNGHPRRNSGGVKGPYASDWAHKSADLGYTAFLAFKNKFPESIHLHLHGCAANKIMVTDSVGWDSPHKLRGAFIDAAEKAIGTNKRFTVVPWRFNGWITGIAMTKNEGGKGRRDNERWVGAEVAVAIHKTTQILTKTIRNLEEDYLKKPRPIALDLELAVPEAEGDDVDLSDEGTEEVPATPAPTVPDPNLEVEEAGEPEVEEMIEEEPPVRPTNPGLEEIAYAPLPKGNRGTKTLACVGISYTNPINDFVTAERCLDGAKNVAKFYRDNSNGKLNLIPKGYHMSYAGEAWKSFSAAELVAKKDFKADYYIIPSVFRKGGNHASNKIAHVVQFTGWVWNHEVGHLLGLPHSGKYVYNKEGKPNYQAYGDEQSPMGNNGYRYLTAPEYYGMGWLGPKGVALYKSPNQTFELTRITAKKIDGPLFGVVVKAAKFAKPNAGRDAFIAFPADCGKLKNGCAALYLGKGAGSQRVALGEEIYDPNFSGLHVKVLSFANNKVKVSIDFQPKI